MTTALLIDLETTGIDEKVDRIIELGICLWDWETGKMLNSYDTLITHPSGNEVPPEITDLTGITSADLGRFGVLMSDALDIFDEWVGQADILVAHNKTFEQKFLKALDIDLPDEMWIDSMTDLPYPKSKSSGSLNDICMNHGIFNLRPHRAIFDVYAMGALISKYDAQEALRIAKTPEFILVANVSFDQKDLAKNAGYRWDRVVPKTWSKKVKETHVDTEIINAVNAGFNIDIRPVD
jgi:DNA polymerase-3 subunit epsilon